MAYIEISYISKALGREVQIKAILPNDGMYDNYEAPYKTLYLLPGYSASATQLITYLGLRAQAELKGIAIVLPDGENLFYQDLPDRQTFFSQYVGEELVEETRKMLPLSRKREDTFIGGISMGGYGALYNGIKYKETFSKVVAFSPACDAYDLMVGHEDGGFSEAQFEGLFSSHEEYMKNDTNITKAWIECKEKRPELFLCCGRNDVAVFSAVEPFEKALVENNVEHIYIEGAGNHELYYWQQMLDPAFSFLVGIEPDTRNRLVIPDFTSEG